MNPLATYRNGGFQVAVYDNGTKVRTQLDQDASPTHPEQMDLKITDWCDAGCIWCHEQSTRRGRHGDVDAMLRLLSDLPPGVEIAIGGGDPLSHPEFERLVIGLRDAGLIPSVTVNGRHVARHLATLEKLTSQGCLFGVGVSFHEQFDTWDYEHKVVHMIAGVDDPRLLLKAPRRKVLVLGYKDFGRGQKFRQRRGADIDANVALWFRLLPVIGRHHHLSFDTLAIGQLRPERLFRDPAQYRKRFMGEEGQFSMYVDGVEQTCAISSYSHARYPWTDIRQMFAVIRHESGHADDATLPHQESAIR